MNTAAIVGAPQLVRLPVILQHIGVSKPTLYARIKEGLFPHGVSFGGNSVVWPADEIAELTKAYIAGKSRTEIAELVKELEAKRKET